MNSKMLDKGSLGLLAMGHVGLEAFRSKKWKEPERINFPKKKRVLLIGWDAADWGIINPLLDGGKMPTLSKIVNNGVIGNIATLDPPLSPILWTSIATGKRPYKHGVLGFTEAVNNGKSLRPVTNRSRKVKALWNILNESDLKTHVVGWWPSHPAEEVNGIQISNFYGKIAYNTTPDNWAQAKGTIHPADLSDKFKALRFHPAELNESLLLPFVPNAHLIDQTKDNRLQHIVKYLCECISIQAASTYILENNDWDFMGVYFDAIDHFSHVFMKYHPPKLNGVKDEVFELYKDVMSGIYIFHDMMLEHLLKYTDDQTTVMILSDHGFYSNHLRQLVLPKEPAAIAREHNPLGVLAVTGPSIKKDELIYGASLLDITPTILNVFNLPIGEDMDGKVLSSIFKNTDQKIDVIKTWEKEGKVQTNNQDLDLDKDTLQQLVDLGYIDSDVTDSPENIAKQIDEQNFYLARAYIGGSKLDDAIKILVKLTIKYPDNYRYLKKLVDCYSKSFKIKEIAELRLKEEAKEKPLTSFLNYLLIAEYLISNRYDEALKILLDQESKQGKSVDIDKKIAECYLKTKDWEGAKIRFKSIIDYDPNDQSALYGLGLANLKSGDLEMAVNYFLDVINITYYSPLAHYGLGDCLYQMKRFNEAANAWEMCYRLFPGFEKVRLQLINLYSTKLQNEDRLTELIKIGKNRKSKNIYIVSGLPRSGTSMMMKMLMEGGMELLADETRVADENNKEGYFEYEPIKNMHNDVSFLKYADEKVIKVILPLLKFLPERHRYKIIIMRRDLQEILDSQYKMLQNMGKLTPNTSSLTIEESFRNQLAFIDKVKEQSHFDALEVNYKDVISNSSNEIERICSFFNNKTLDKDKMEKVVKSDLYRSRRELA